MVHPPLLGGVVKVLLVQQDVIIPPLEPHGAAVRSVLHTTMPGTGATEHGQRLQGEEGGDVHHHLVGKDTSVEPRSHSSVECAAGERQRERERVWHTPSSQTNASLAHTRLLSKTIPELANG